MKTVADAVEEFFINKGLIVPGTPRDEWYADNWVRIPVKGFRIPILPIHGFKKSLILHDVNHVLTDYGIGLKGELEIAAWELASGGCGKYYLYWFDRFFFLFLGLLLFPKAMIKAWQRGRQQRNVFTYDIDKVMEMDVKILRLLSDVT